MLENFSVIRNKNFGQILIATLPGFWVKLWKKIEKFAKTFEEFAEKLDKMSIRDWGSVKKVQQKLEEGINFE